MNNILENKAQKIINKFESFYKNDNILNISDSSLMNNNNKIYSNKK
jgi:hypothetical protein